jgi:biotin carboxyl carrier protein
MSPCERGSLDHLVLWFAAASILLACRQPETRKEPAFESALSAATRWVHPVAAREAGILEAAARVISSPNDTAQVCAPLAARVVRMRVRPGQRVAAGEPLVDVVMPELLRAASVLRAAQLRVRSWETRRQIIAPLVEKRLAQAAELSDIDANLAAVRGELESARASVRVAGESDKRVAALLDGNGVIALRAPLAGIVVATQAKIGELREPSAGPLVELVSEDVDLWVEARFMSEPPPGVRFMWVEPTRTLALVLERLSPHADERDGSRVGWLRASDGRAALVAGALGRVRVVPEEGWVLVGARALRERDGVFTVERKTRDGSRSVRVQVVQRNATEALISGLAADAQIAADVTAIAELDR